MEKHWKFWVGTKNNREVLRIVRDWENVGGHLDLFGQFEDEGWKYSGQEKTKKGLVFSFKKK